MSNADLVDQINVFNRHKYGVRAKQAQQEVEDQDMDAHEDEGISETNMQNNKLNSEQMEINKQLLGKRPQENLIDFDTEDIYDEIKTIGKEVE